MTTCTFLNTPDKNKVWGSCMHKFLQQHQKVFPRKYWEKLFLYTKKKIFSNSTFHKPLCACTNTFAISYIYKTEHHFTELNKSIKNWYDHHKLQQLLMAGSRRSIQLYVIEFYFSTLPGGSSPLLHDHLLGHWGKSEFPSPLWWFLGAIIL